MKQKTTKIIFLISLFSFLSSCLFNKDKISKNKLNQSIGEIKDGLESGYWKYQQNNQVTKEGEYFKGRKIGLWKYYIPDTIMIEWTKYISDSLGFEIAYPSSYKVNDKSNLAFIAGKNKNDFYVIVRNKKNDKFDSLLEYLNEAKNILTANKINTKVEFRVNKLLLEDGKEIINGAIYTETHEGKYISYVTYLEDDEGNIYDLTHKQKVTTLEEANLNQTVYNDFIKGLFIKNRKVFKEENKIIQKSQIDMNKL